MMFGRPRCREWTPLATQQLRLRSLIQIVGYNIRPPESCTHQCSYYLTLHQTTMSAPFYTSERICSPHPKWKEIDSEITQSMSSTNVVIRIWCHVVLPINADEKCEMPQDTVIQTWGVYFSGLRYIGANLALNFTSDCFKSNTLVFQMHGGYFCSYKSLKMDVMPPENELEQGSLSSESSGRTNISKIIFDHKTQNHRLSKESRSISPSKYSKLSDKEYSKSHSPVERGLRQNFATLKTSASLNISLNQRELRSREGSSERQRCDPSQIYEHSPDHLDVTTGDVNCTELSKFTSREELSSSKIDLSETAESYDLRNESDGEPKYRYLALSFLKSEIRPSYDAGKLQKLHLLQYSIKKRQEAVQEIKARIYKKSALTDDAWARSDDQNDLKQRKSRSQRNLFSPDESLGREKSSSHGELTVKNGKIKDDRPVSNGPRLTLKLNDLLSFKSKPSPFQRAEYVRLTKQLEILRFKRIILSDERDSKLANIRRLKEKQSKLFEENQDVGLELMENYHTLSRRNELLRETKQSCAAMRELAARNHAALANQRCELLTQLHQIFYIEQSDSDTWRILDVPLPICDDENTRPSNAVCDSVAAGFVAQATSLAAAILNQPLRYKITLLGSASKILDVMPDWPDPNIPLFARGGDVSLFRYAMFLLNKCIAQLLWGRGLAVTDMRPTLSNLQRLLTAPSNLSDTSKLFGTYRWLADNKCPKTQSLRSLVASERGKYRQFNRFKDGVEGRGLMMNVRRHKHSRSVGSYRDDQELSTLDASTTSIMGSDSNIYNMKLTSTDSTDNHLKGHSSDSEISKMGGGEGAAGGSSEVIFTLGDDSTLIGLDTERLVKMSVNNGDEWRCVEDVKRICTEIESYCTVGAESELGGRESGESRPWMKGCPEIEDGAVTCDSCDRNASGECDIACAAKVTEVIVIPSAEAILDTGQSASASEKSGVNV
ncbi:unnamed protein product, partial [Iphiclides podalirius]